MYATTASVSVVGLTAHPVQVEVDIADGLPAFTIVGLPDATVQEARERVRSAVRNAGFRFPARRVTVNLAPADLRKEGAFFDLPVAVGILKATGQLETPVDQYVFLGELSLEGALRPVRGVLPAVAGHAAAGGSKTYVVPRGNIGELGLLEGIKVIAADSLGQVVAAIAEGTEVLIVPPYVVSAVDMDGEPDLAEVKGQAMAKRAIEVAAAGGHNILLTGSPGSGKTMLAERLPGIMPPMSQGEVLEVTTVYSAAGLLEDGHAIVERRPFRHPHHTASSGAVIGGGQSARPGEISLADRGVLFMDELPEFHRDVLEVLRQPLESGTVTISRVRQTLTYPAHFLLVAAMNPCPCGWYGDTTHPCTCSPVEVRRYRSRISGPLLDRFDMVLAVPRLQAGELADLHAGESSRAVRERVMTARERAGARLHPLGLHANADLSGPAARRLIVLDHDGQFFLEAAVLRFGLSGRGYDKVLKVARTIADLDGSAAVRAEHLSEALQYRSNPTSWDE
jgi:magnesium chelatase family protein